MCYKSYSRACSSNQCTREGGGGGGGGVNCNVLSRFVVHELVANLSL